VSVLVDSDILIEVSRGRNAEVTAHWKALAQSGTAILYSPVTAAELWAGVRPAEHAVLENLFRQLICVEIDGTTGRRAGDYMRQFAKSHKLELGDALIAASATLHRAQLWTRNRKHYPMKDLEFFS
jgi:predicted nucleic acid-binding protein